jgi:hypothetical protein
MPPRASPSTASSGWCRWGTSGSPRTFLSIGVADWWISGFPRISRLPAVPSPLSSGCPVSAATAGSMLSPRLRSNFASAAILLANPRVSPLHAPAGCAADESSSSIGSCNPCLTSRCNLNLFRSTTCGKPPVFSRVPLLPHLPALPELQSNSLQGHQLENARGLRPWRSPDAFVAHRNVHQPFGLCCGCRITPTPALPAWLPSASSGLPRSRRFRPRRRRSSGLPLPFSP